MTVRAAELAMAIFLALVSIIFMVKSAENYIMWVPGRGPGAGSWPFWLAAGMLLTCLWTILRWFRGTTPESHSNALYMDRQAIKVVGTAVLALTGLLAGCHIIGIYFSLMLFLFFFVYIYGGNELPISLALSLLLPVGIFIFFEWALKVPLPKGYSEPLFYPIYAIIY